MPRDEDPNILVALIREALLVHCEKYKGIAHALQVNDTKPDSGLDVVFNRKPYHISVETVRASKKTTGSDG